MSEPDLKPCPFCGGQAHIMKMGYPHWVLCKQCGAKVHGGKFGEKEGEAASIEAWNRRASYSCDHEKDHTADIGKKVSIPCAHENDPISRQMAIDTIMGQPPEPHYPSWYAAQIEKLPAVQPATSCSEIPNSSTDCISRQAAIDVALEDVSDKRTHEFNAGAIRAVNRIKSLPSAQPETAKRIVGKSRDGMTLWHQCDMCNEPVHEKDEFCPGCGRRLTDG